MKNKLYAVGIGPGDYSHMTLEAVRVLEHCDVIVGYTVYVDLVREHFPGKEFLTTPMRREEERCRHACREKSRRDKPFQERIPPEVSAFCAEPVPADCGERGQSKVKTAQTDK